MEFKHFVPDVTLPCCTNYRPFRRNCNPTEANISICNVMKQLLRDCKSLYYTRSDCKSDRTKQPIRLNKTTIPTEQLN